MTHLTITDSPKMIRETLCVAQVAIGAYCRQSIENGMPHIERLNRLIAACDELRPLGPDGTHGKLHISQCGCDDTLPRPIEQADIRVGDLVQRDSTRADGTVTMVRGRVVDVEPDRVRISDMWSGKPRGAQIEWTLIERDPDRELIEAMAATWVNGDIGEPLRWEDAEPARREELREGARAALATIRETHDIVPKAGGGA